MPLFGSGDQTDVSPENAAIIGAALVLDAARRSGDRVVSLFCQGDSRQHVAFAEILVFFLAALEPGIRGGYMGRRWATLQARILEAVLAEVASGHFTFESERAGASTWQLSGDRADWVAAEVRRLCSEEGRREAWDSVLDSPDVLNCWERRWRQLVAERQLGASRGRWADDSGTAAAINVASGEYADIVHEFGRQLGLI